MRRKGFMAMTGLRVAIAVVMVSLVATGAAAQNTAEAGKIATIFEPYANHDAPGMTVIALRKGKLVFEGAYGLADVEHRVPNTLKTNFRLASLTKEFTAMAVMLLAKDGRLHYDDTLTRFFPGFPEYGKKITVRELLNHTSGLKDYEDLYDAEMRGTPAEKVPQIHDDEILRMMEKQTGGKFEPGTRWEYSNTGYALLALIVGRVSGESYPEFLRERIFKPLGMKHSVAFVQGKNTVPNRAFGYRTEDGGAHWVFSDQSSTSAVLGDGGVYTNVLDMAKWDAGLREHKLLTEAEMEPALTPAAFLARGPYNEPAQYGFGWYVNPYKGHKRMWHYGETCGFLTSIQRLTDDGITVVVLANRTDIDPGALALRVLDVMLGKGE